MLSTSYEFFKKGTSCKCVDTKQICVLLPSPSDLFMCFTFPEKRKLCTFNIDLYIYLYLYLSIYIYTYMSRQVVSGSWCCLHILHHILVRLSV